MTNTTPDLKPDAPIRPARPPSDIDTLVRDLLRRGLVPQVARTIAAEALLRRGWEFEDAQAASDELLRRIERALPADDSSPPPPTEAEVHAAFELIKSSATVEWVPIERTFADRYQRTISDARIRDYERRGFQPHALGTVVLSLRAPLSPQAGLYAIVDGHHRVQLVRRQGWPEIHASVLRGLSYEKEADLFGVLNYRLPVSALGKFNARLEQREEVALSIRDILAQFGLRVGKSMNNSYGMVNAVDAVDRAFNEIGPVGLFQMFAILTAAWDREPGAYNGAILDGAKQFWMRYHRTADPIRLVERLKKEGPDALVRHAASNSGATGTRIGKQMLTLYNNRLKLRLDDWVDHPGRTLDVNREYTQIPFPLRAYRPVVEGP